MSSSGFSAIGGVAAAGTTDLFLELWNKAKKMHGLNDQALSRLLISIGGFDSTFEKLKLVAGPNGKALVAVIRIRREADVIS